MFRLLEKALAKGVAASGTAASNLPNDRLDIK